MGAIAGSVATYFKTTGGFLVEPALYGLATTVLFLMGFAAIRASAHFRREEPVTPQNIKARITEWVLGFGLALKKQVNSGSDGDNHFALEVTTPTNRNISVRRPRQREKYLAIETRIFLAPADQTAYHNLTPQQREVLSRNLTLTLTSLNLSYRLDPSSGVLALQKRIPITQSLTEDLFLSSLERLEGAINSASATMLNAVRP